MLLESARCQQYDKPVHSVKPGYMRTLPERPDDEPVRIAQQNTYMDLCLFSKSPFRAGMPPGPIRRGKNGYIIP